MKNKADVAFAEFSMETHHVGHCMEAEAVPDMTTGTFVIEPAINDDQNTITVGPDIGDQQAQRWGVDWCMRSPDSEGLYMENARWGQGISPGGRERLPGRTARDCHRHESREPLFPFAMSVQHYDCLRNGTKPKVRF
jgi:hypothetical protein